MSALDFQLAPEAPRKSVTHKAHGKTFVATAARPLINVAHGMLRGIGELDPAQLLDGAMVWSGFSPYWLRQTEHEHYVVEGPDFDWPDAFYDHHTDDLTLHMWISAQQLEAAKRAGTQAVHTPVDHEVSVQRAVITMLEEGTEGTIVMQRHRVEQDAVPDEERGQRSGWHVVVPGRVDGEQGALLRAAVGSFIALFPEAGPLLGLPPGAFLQFSGARLSGAWLLDEKRMQELGSEHPGVKMGEAIFGGLVAEPILSELFVEGDLAEVSRERRPAPPQPEGLLSVASALLELPSEDVMEHADVLPEVRVLRFRNPATGQALVVGQDRGMLLGEDTDVLVSRYLRGARFRA